MPEVPSWAWFSVAAVIAAAVLSLLRSMAVQVRNDDVLHDLRRRVFEVRIGYLKQIIATYQPFETTAEVIEDPSSERASEEPRMAA